MREFFKKLAGGNSQSAATPIPASHSAPYTAPLWLLAPPQQPTLPWLWQTPTLEAPVSQMCTSEQMQGELYETLCRKAGMHPSAHRKVWEFIYIYAAFERFGLIGPDRRLLGFGTGSETLPSAFAAQGAQVMATDAPADLIKNMGWDTTNQHSVTADTLYRDYLLPRDAFDRLVQFEAADMNNIPATFRNFDGCWSACALEHLGSIDHGLTFIEKSLETLRPGGIAVHTTELNLSSNDVTFDMHNLALFRRKDFERLTERLIQQGHEVMPLNFHPGSGEFDQHIDLPPYGLPHLKLQIAEYVTTSFGMIVKKRD